MKGLHTVYSATVDRAKFREVASRVVVFGLPLFYWGRQPEWAGMGIVALGMFVRGWGAGHLRKDQKMALGGPYLLVRHPLYLGSCLLALGLIITLHHWLVTLLVGGLTISTYVHVIRHEEKNLLARFGRPYAEYCKNVAPLWPTMTSLRMFFGKKPAAVTRFSVRQYFKNKEWEALLGVLVIFVVLYLGSR